MKYLPENIGLYIHIPFCAKKCRYCDFYSACLNEKVYKDYLFALFREIRKWGGKTHQTVDTVYIGGGTPSLLGRDIISLLSVVRESFSIADSAEITAECNPNSKKEFLLAAYMAGVNRLSFGAQSGDNAALANLGRTHTAEDSIKAVRTAREIGFDNISCDIMIALPDSSAKTLKRDIDFICSLNPDHISAYILKIEPNTAFYKMQGGLNLPDDDGAADQYLTLCYELRKRGFRHYEISNFARKGKKSRHNLKYWRCEEYLGIGPSAHSCVGGKRFFYPRDMRAFIAGNEPVYDGECSKTDEIMLALRTNDGVAIGDIPLSAMAKIEKFNSAGLSNTAGGKVFLTDKGMLLSNSIITEILYEDL